MLERKFTMNFRLGNKKNDTIYIMEGEKNIGHAVMVFDEESHTFDGILVLHEYLERQDIFRIGQMIQYEVVAPDEEMFLETYFGTNFGLICDENPNTWRKLVAPCIY